MTQLTIKVLFFGQLVDVTGKTGMDLQDVTDTQAALEALTVLYPRLSQTPFLLALDKEIVEGKVPFTGDHTLALLPPYAGG